MNLTIHIPNDIAGQIGATLGGSDLTRRALEALAVDEFKNQRIGAIADRVIQVAHTLRPSAKGVDDPDQIVRISRQPTAGVANC